MPSEGVHSYAATAIIGERERCLTVLPQRLFSRQPEFVSGPSEPVLLAVRRQHVRTAPSRISSGHNARRYRHTRSLRTTYTYYALRTTLLSQLSQPPAVSRQQKLYAR